MTGSTDDAIWKDIDKSGVELELRVAEMVRATQQWHVSSHQYYVDQDEGKGRETDLRISREDEINVPHYKLTIQFVILVECKKVPGNSWTFFCSTRGHHGDSSAVDFLGTEGRRSLGFTPLINAALKEKIRYDAYCSDYRETILDKNKSNRRTENIFDATISVAKATKYYETEQENGLDTGREEYVEEFLYDRVITQTSSRIATHQLYDHVWAYQPAIVFDGPLYVATLNPRELKQANFVRLGFDYRSSKYDIKDLPIDVCTTGYVPEYLKQISASVNRFKELLSSKKYKKPIKGDPYVEGKSQLENRHLDVMENLTGWSRNRLKKMHHREKSK